MSRDALTITTPEGIPLAFRLAPVGERALAFTIDVGVIAGATLALGLLVLMGAGGSGLFGAFFIFASFVLRSFYFVLFELFRQGATPGKRSQRIRVVAADGGPLTARAVFARNVTRELETFVPLLAVTHPQLVFGDVGPVAGLLAVAWLLVFALMPFFNRQRLRVGDLIAGTRVVLVPRAELLEDLSAEAVRAARYVFTEAQLGHYGNYELQVLEDLLRKAAVTDEAALAAVCEKIKRRIEWDRDAWNVAVLPFLRDFYAAQRAHLERGLLLGRRHADKGEARASRRG